jgi:hypothetical protein
MLITADAGGSTGWRLRLWKLELQRLADETGGVAIAVCHFPPGTSKWNKVEHRLFSFISSSGSELATPSPADAIRTPWLSSATAAAVVSSCTNTMV